jgi:hypothetical protein
MNYATLSNSETITKHQAAVAFIETEKADALTRPWVQGWIDLPKVPMQGSSGYHAIGLSQIDGQWVFNHITNRTGYQRYDEPITEDEAIALIEAAS